MLRLAFALSISVCLMFMNFIATAVATAARIFHRNGDTHAARTHTGRYHRCSACNANCRYTMPIGERTHNKFTIKWQNDNSYTQWFALCMRASARVLQPFCHEKVENETRQTADERKKKDESRTKWNIIHGIFRTCWSPSLPIAGAVAVADNSDQQQKRLLWISRFFYMRLVIERRPCPNASESKNMQ